MPAQANGRVRLGGNGVDGQRKPAFEMLVLVRTRPVVLAGLVTDKADGICAGLRRRTGRIKPEFLSRQACFEEMV